jgi:hypothetical protein
MRNRRAELWLVASLFMLGTVSTAYGATWNLITPGETHYNEVVTRLGHPTLRTQESRAFKNVSTVIHTVWEGSDAPEGYERVDILFNIDSLLPLLITVVPANMPRPQVHKEYGMPERSETSKSGVLMDHYDILGLAVTYMPNGQTVRKMEFFEGVRGRYGR